MVKPLYIPPNKKWKGLKVWCGVCKTTVDDTCRLNDQSIFKCPNGDKHRLKIIEHVPGTRNSRVTRTLETRDYDEAVKQAIEFSKEVKQRPKNHDGNSIKSTENEDNEKNIPRLFIHAQARYIAWLEGEGIPNHHKRRNRSAEYIKDVKRGITKFIKCMKANGIDMKSLRIDTVTDKMVGMFHKNLTKDLKFSNRNYNKIIGYLTSFVKWYSDEYNYPIRNYFEKAERRPIFNDPKSISKDEFTALLKIITPDRGSKEYEKGKKRTRNLYKSWLAHGIRLGLETGRRREEILSLKYSDILEYNDGTKNIKTEDFKVNRIQNRNESRNKKFNFIPVTKTLLELLNELGYEKYKDTENYILAPEITKGRTRLMADALTKGFSHYYDQLNTGEHLTFKSLRKTYITNLEIYMGNAKAITGHSSDEVLRGHYLDQESISRAAKDYSVFSTKDQRKESLEQIRNSITNDEKGKGIGK